MEGNIVQYVKTCSWTFETSFTLYTPQLKPMHPVLHVSLLLLLMASHSTDGFSLQCFHSLGNYMQMMNVLQPIAFDVLECLSQLFDYYLYGVKKP